MLTDVVFGGDVEFLGLVAGFMPLLDGGFAEVLGFFGGDVFDLGGLLGGAFLERGGLLRGGAGELAGLFRRGGAKILGGLADRRRAGETGFRIEGWSWNKRRTWRDGVDE